VCPSILPFRQGNAVTSTPAALSHPAGRPLMDALLASVEVVAA
jgi:hypothetical protein